MLSAMRPRRTLFAPLALLAVCGGAWAQSPQVFQFFASAADATGAPVTDLRPQDVVVLENLARQQVAKVEPVSVPVKLTIAIDNSGDSAEALAHYRSGLTGLVEALPPDVEVTLITTAPQPRFVLRASTDRVRILRAINGFATEPGRPRFTDALVEFGRRLQQEAKDPRVGPYVPVLLMVSTTAVEQTSYESREIDNAVNFMVNRRARLIVAIMSTRTGQAALPETVDASLQGIVAIPIVKATNGRYEALSASSRIATLLPELGREVAALHARHANQFRVTVERSAAGPPQNVRIQVAREGVKGVFTYDGYLP